MKCKYLVIAVCVVLISVSTVWAAKPVTRIYDFIFDPGHLKPVDSQIKVKVGEAAPDFELLSIEGKTIRLSDFKGKNNVVLSFIPAAWTPVCSGQWPGYNIAQKRFQQNNTTLLGISVDNRPTLWAWTQQMGELWFPVLSDFYPHGAVAQKYGVLRSDGTADRVLVYINKNGIVTALDVSDINTRTPLEQVFEELDRFSTSSN